MKKIIRKICSNIESIESKLITYDLELIYNPEKIELTKENNDKVIKELKLQLEKWNELLDILLNDK